jgi:transcriptional regulator with XRE-family HTH domain
MFLLVSCTITGMSVDEWKRAGEKIIARRIALGMTTTTALAQRTGLSARMLGDIENARRQNFAKPTIAQIEHALEWAPGSIDSILSGGDPTPLHGEQAAPVVSEQTDELARVRHIVSHTWGIAPRLVTHALAGNPTSGHLDAVSDAIGIIDRKSVV